MVADESFDTVSIEGDTGDETATGAGAPTRARLSPYRVLRYLGSGGMGIVYEAIDDEFGDRVALKTLSRVDAWRLFRLKQEFRLLAGVRHENLVRHEALMCDDGIWFLAMEFVAGQDIVSAVRAAPQLLRPALAQLARGVMALHEAGLLHLDLKPANVMVEASGRVVILDFGLARPLDGTHATRASGTPGFMAPEVAAGGHPGRASDWFAIGAILAQLLAQLAEAPGDLVDLCTGLLAQRPGDRPDGSEVVRRLAGASPREPARALPELIGRGQELDALRGELMATRAGTPRFVRVSGSSGMGKTALTRRFLAEVERTGAAVVLSGRCYECEAVPYAGIDALIDTLARQIASPSSSYDGEALRAAAAMFPVLSTLSQGAIPEEPKTAEGRERAIRGLRSLLAGAAGDRMLVLFLDDLHLARADTAALLLDLLAPREDGLKLLVLATCRSDQEVSSDCLRELAARAMARGQTLCEARVEVPPLTAESCAALVRAHLGPKGGGEVELYVREAKGNPLLVEALATSQGASRTVSELVARRLDSLSPAARRLMAMVALSGRPLPQGVLARATGPEAFRAALRGLSHDSLVRTYGVRRWDTVEPFHDRIREEVAARLSASQRVELHGELARSLEAEDHGSPELRMHHWAGAGELRRASTYAEQAADEAERALAFERAAELLEAAAEWTDEAERRPALRNRQGRALMRAGRSAAAAEAYLRCAELTADEARRAAERAAAEAWMAAGFVDRGLALLRPMLAVEGLSWPRSSVSAGLALLWAYARLRAGGTAAATDPSPALCRRVDLCWSLGMGLTNVMPVWGMLFMVEGLRAALECGDQARLGRSLAVLGGFHRLLGRAAIGERYLLEARAIAEALADAQMMGLSHVCSAADAMLTGEWREVVSRTQRGLRVLPARSIGVTWERVLGACFELAALDQIGDLREVERRAREHLHDAEARGDLYGQVVFQQFVGQSLVAAGDTAVAREHAAASLSRWTRGGYTVQHFYALRIAISCDLYDGDVTAARERLRDEWRSVEAGGLLRNPISRIDALLLRARCALAAGQRREALVVARRLAGEARADGKVHACWIRARAGGRDGAALLGEALRGFEARGMMLCAAAIERLRSAGRDEAADGTLARLGARDPERWMRYFMP